MTLFEMLRPGVLALALGACASSGPPPRPVEVPIDNSPPSGTLFAPDAAPGPDFGNGGGSTVLTPGSMTGGSVAVPTDTGLDPAHANTTAVNHVAAARAPIPRSQRLLQSDCNRLLDKYVILVAISQGVAATQVKNVMPMMRQQVQNDAAYAHVQGSCTKENSKRQYGCAMKSASIDDWKACLE